MFKSYSLMLFYISLLVVAILAQQNGLTQQQLDNMLSDHNIARASLATPVANNMIELRWDPILAETAYNYLVRQGCTGGFQHNPSRSQDYWNNGGRNGATPSNSASNPIYVGENWYSLGPDNQTDSVFGGAVKAWTTSRCSSASYSNGKWTCTSQHCSEEDYFYKTVGCVGTFEDYGHFTQTMWATTAWVGCGYTQACGTLCDYVPGGNVNLPANPQPSDIWGVGGAAASNCSAGYMPLSNGLCGAAPTYGSSSSSSSTTSSSTSSTGPASSSSSSSTSATISPSSSSTGSASPSSSSTGSAPSPSSTGPASPSPSSSSVLPVSLFNFASRSSSVLPIFH